MLLSFAIGIFGALVAARLGTGSCEWLSACTGWSEIRDERSPDPLRMAGLTEVSFIPAKAMRPRDEVIAQRERRAEAFGVVSSAGHPEPRTQGAGRLAPTGPCNRRTRFWPSRDVATARQRRRRCWEQLALLLRSWGSQILCFPDRVRRSLAARNLELATLHTLLQASCCDAAMR